MKRIRLTERRTTVGLSQEVLAEQLGVDRTTIIRWESGKAMPQPWQRPNLALALKVSVEELAVLLDPYGSGAPDGLTGFTARGRHPLTADMIMDTRIHYEQMYRGVGGIPVRPRLESFIYHRVAPALRTAGHDDHAQRGLRRAAASLIAVAGVCAYDAEQHQSAERHFTHALRLAQATEDIPLAGYITALMINQALCLGRTKVVVQLAESALRGGRGQLSAALVSDLHSMQAKAYALAGAHAECRTQLRHAEAQIELIKPDEEPKETSYIHPGLMELKSAESLLKLRELGVAKTFAEASMSLGPQGADPRGQFYAQATLAMILSAQRQVEEGLAWAQRALTSARGMESRRIRQHVDGLARSFLPFGDNREVHEFLAHTRRFLAISAQLAYSLT